MDFSGPGHGTKRTVGTLICSCPVGQADSRPGIRSRGFATRLHRFNPCSTGLDQPVLRSRVSRPSYGIAAPWLANRMLLMTARVPTRAVAWRLAFGVPPLGTGED